MTDSGFADYLKASKPFSGVSDTQRAELLQQAVHQRWSVKTAADAGAQALVKATATVATIAELIALPIPAVLPPDGRSDGAEKTFYEIHATLTGYKLESDGDYHLVIADANGKTMIAEIPSPAAATGSFFLQPITTARQDFEARFHPVSNVADLPPTGMALVVVNVPVTLHGLGYFDFLHGQDGVAPNGIELHPVTDIVFAP
jgi:hypothetical protein